MSEKNQTTIELIRETYTKSSVLGSLFINGKFQCNTLEDFDRGLKSTMSESQIKGIKIQNQTAIPLGTYKVILSYSPRFNRVLPLILNVKGFKGVRIHSGNNEEHTEGCILVGQSIEKNYLVKSRLAYLKLHSKLVKASKSQEIFIIIRR